MDSSFGIGGHGSQSNAVKFYYSKRKEFAPKELRRSATSRQVVATQAPPPLPCSNDEWVAGAFYEIDHEKLPPKSPIHLKAVRVVKVSETTKLDVTVFFPSTYSLRNYFSSIAAKSSSGRGDQIPELDEMFVMSTNHASKILRRLVPSSQMDEEKHLQSFWLVAPFVLPGSTATAPKVAAAESHDESRMLPEPVGGLQLALKYSGNIEWGHRRRVRYISRPLEAMPLPSAKREDEDESEPMEEVNNVICTRKRAREACKKSKKKGKKEKAVAEIKDKKRIKSKKKRLRYEKGEKVKREESERARPVRGSKDRWSAERYESAELKLLDIMREKGAVLGSPILRQQLRDEARKHIGDTGLLDHLLKHMAGKVVNERSERFRRRHNADGAMEYWLEPAELDEVRKKAGAIDPYWLPPAGWKQGDAASSACTEWQKEISELKEEIIILRSGMEELQELKRLEKEDRDQQQQSEAAYIILQEKYEMLVEKNKKLEEEMGGLIGTLNGVKEEMLLLKQERVKREEEEEGRKKAMAAAEEENKAVVEDAKVGGGGDAEGGAAGKINERRKGSLRRSGFRICKPPGTFLWPNMASSNNIVASNSSSQAALFSMISNTSTANSTVTSTSAAPATATVGIGSGSGHGGVAVVPADHYGYQLQQQQLAMMFGGAGSGSAGGIPTPPSCSSTATSAPRLLLLPSPTTPRSSTSSSPAAAAPPAVQQQMVVPVPPLAAQHGSSGTRPCSSSPMYRSLVAAVARASVGDQVKKGEDSSSSSLLNGQAEAAAAEVANWSRSCNIATDLVLATPSPTGPYL